MFTLQDVPNVGILDFAATVGPVIASARGGQSRSVQCGHGEKVREVGLLQSTLAAAEDMQGGIDGADIRLILIRRSE
jgi:hypothetical protein